MGCYQLREEEMVLEAANRLGAEKRRRRAQEVAQHKKSAGK